MIRKLVFPIILFLIASGNIYANPTLSTPTVALTEVTFSISASGYEIERACDYRVEIEEYLIEPSICIPGEDIKFEFLRFMESESESVKLILDGNVVSEERVNVRTLTLSSDTTFPSSINFTDSDSDSMNLKNSNLMSSPGMQIEGSIRYSSISTR